MLKQVIFILIICFKLGYQSQTCSGSYPGTTPSFKNIFIGRCFYFLNILHKQDCNISLSELNCTKIWEDFSNVIINRNPCDIKNQDYDKYIESTSHIYDRNKSIFWSGTYVLAHQISKLIKYWTVEETLSGFLLDELSFCSSVGSTDFIDVCQVDCVSSNNPFWNAISTNYAKKAIGNVLVILNGTRTEGAVSNRSTFYKYELFNFNFTQIKQVKVILLHSNGKPKYETCKNPKTLHLIKDFVELKNSTFMCEDDNFYVNYFDCGQNPSNIQCKNLMNVINKSIKSSQSNFFNFLFFILIQFLYNFIN